MAEGPTKLNRDLLVPLGLVGTLMAAASSATAWVVTQSLGTRFELRFVQIEYALRDLGKEQAGFREELERQGRANVTREEWERWVELLRHRNNGLVTPETRR